MDEKKEIEGNFHSIAFHDGALVLIDQRKLPREEVYLECRTEDEVAEAIKTMVVRGAPAIGVAASYGMALAAARYTGSTTDAQREALERAAAGAGRHAPHGGESFLGD